MDEIITAAKTAVRAMLNRAGSSEVSGEEAQALAAAANITMTTLTLALHNKADEEADADDTPKELLN